MADPFLEDYSDMRIQQRFALATLYYASGGDEEWYNIAKEGWLSYNHECTWNFTTDTGHAYTDHNEENHVPMPKNPCGEEVLQMEDGPVGDLHFQELWLPEAGLHAEQLPLELFLLTSLKTLNLAANFISGTISTEIGLLTDLEAIQVCCPQFVSVSKESWPASHFSPSSSASLATMISLAPCHLRLECAPSFLLLSLRQLISVAPCQLLWGSSLSWKSYTLKIQVIWRAPYLQSWVIWSRFTFCNFTPITYQVLFPRKF